jgi:uncharacterized protein YndB with AHSA1/START domain
MALAAATPSQTADREIVVSRVFNAPRALVFQAWSSHEHLAHWYGPDGFTITTHEMAFEPGGVWRFIMHGPDGRDYPNRVIFKEVVEAERLVYTHDDGGEAAVPVSFETRVTFDEVDGGKTKLTMRSVFATKQEKDRVEREHGAVEGGLQHVGRLAEYLAMQSGGKAATLTICLPSEKEVILRRVFNAPRNLVFQAMTQPEHVRNWWGCKAFTMTVCEMDFRVGGSWRFVQRAPDGSEHPFRGDYLEIAAPERVVQTFVYDVEGIRDFPATETVTLVEQDGKTILTNRIVHLNQQARDGHFYSGMELGATESMNRLEELVASMGS